MPTIIKTITLFFNQYHSSKCFSLYIYFTTQLWSNYEANTYLNVPKPFKRNTFVKTKTELKLIVIATSVPAPIAIPI